MNLKFKTTLLFCAFFALGKVSSQNKYSMAFEGSLHDSYCPQNTTKEGRVIISDTVDLGKNYSICFWAKNSAFFSDYAHIVCDINGKIRIGFVAPSSRAGVRNILQVVYNDEDRWGVPGELAIEEKLKGSRGCDTSVLNWNFYSIIIDTNKIKIYVNGHTLKTQTIAKNHYHKGELVIGDNAKFCSSGNYNFDGNIDELSIWKGPLDSVKINNLMFRQPNLSDSDLSHYWSFDKGSGNTVLDSKNSVNGSMNSGATWSNELPYLECLQCADSFAFNSDTLNFEGCSRDSLKIVASGNWAEYAWSNGSSDSFIYASESGEYRVTLKDSVGCEISDSVHFVNPGAVSVDVLTVDSVTCYGFGDGSVTTESSGGFQPYTYSWNDPLNQSTPNAENLFDGTYKLTVSDKYGCSDSISVEVYEPDELVNFASTIRNIKCHNDSNGVISVEIRGGTKPYTFIWNNNRTTSTEIKNLAAGDYELIVEDKNGCRDTSNYTLSNPDKLEVEIIEPIHTMKSMPVKLNVRVVPVGDDYTYKWEPADVFKQESAKHNPVIVLEETQGLKVNVSTNSGCVGMDSIEMRVLQSLDEILPNAITPDGDGVNDIFKPQEYFDILEFKVYNKWGQLIYDNQGSQEGWDGTFAGDVVPAGVYYYILQVQVKYTDQLIQHSGDITVIK